MHGGQRSERQYKDPRSSCKTYSDAIVYSAPEKLALQRPNGYMRAHGCSATGATGAIDAAHAISSTELMYDGCEK